MNHAEIIALLTDLGARIEAAQHVARMLERSTAIVILDTTTVDTFLARIVAAIAALDNPHNTVSPPTRRDQ